MKICKGSYFVVVEKSSIEWELDTVFSVHFGTLNFDAGEIVFSEDGVFSEAHFVMDMKSLQDKSVEKKKGSDILFSYLKSRYFLNIQEFPTSEYVVLRFEELKGASSELPNYFVYGHLLQKNMTIPVSFGTHITAFQNKTIVAGAHFKVNLEKWSGTEDVDAFLSSFEKIFVFNDLTVKVKIIAEIKE